MRVREASIKDIDKILPVRLEIHQYHYDLDKVYLPRVNLEESFKTQIELFIHDKNAVVLVAEENNNIAGYALGKLKEPHPLFNIPKSGLIDDIGVTSRERNKGIGEKLVNELIQWFKAGGAERIDLKVHDKNKSGLDFWTKMGFSCFTKEMYKPV